MKVRCIRLLPFVSLSAFACVGQAQFLGPSAYLQFSDSPFYGLGLANFQLEDMEDHLFNVAGATADTGIRGSDFGTDLIDSVDADDGVINGTNNDGAGHYGESLWGSGSITITFDDTTFGSLPTHAGGVWTDGVNDITFEAWDENGVSLGTVVGSHADGDFFGGTSEDRFYGVIYAGGISRISFSDPSGIEIDHIQFGGMVPEPGTVAALASGLAILIRRRSK